MISFLNVSKSFKVYESKTGFKGAVQNFFKREYKNKQVLDDVSFEIEDGKIVGLLGSNGAGKTTTLKILSGLFSPTSGTVRINGFDPFEKKNEFKSSIAFVMGQKSQLWWDLSSMESFILMKNIYEIPDKQFEENLNYLLDLFQVREFVNIQVRKLSFGQRMKMEIINSLLHNPKVIFLDEPTIGLDFESQKSIRRFIKEYNRNYKATFIITSHYLNDIEEVCDEIIVLDKGKKLISDSISNIMHAFSDQKILKISFQEELKNPSYLDSLKDYEYKDNILTVKAVKQEINSITSYLLSNEQVEDINIEEVPFEHVIRTIYETKGEGIC